MKYYLIAGEASGDLHGSNLMKHLKILDPGAQFRFWGGDLMLRQGGHLVKHFRDLAFMGFGEVLLNLKTILKNMGLCKSDILSFKPDVVILIDYPGFNLRIAPFAKKSGFKVFYYISPQVWAWNQSRVSAIKKTVDRMYVILPFEKEFYNRFNMDVDYVGHPLLDVVDRYKEQFNDTMKGDFLYKHGLQDKPIVALLPGSRKQEIEKILPTLVSVANTFMVGERSRTKGIQFVVGGISSIPESLYRKCLKKRTDNIKLVVNDTYRLLLSANAAVVTSGTATLETALFGVPEVVCYKGNYLSYLIAKRLVRVSFISLANLIMEEKIVEELIQGNFSVTRISAELKRLLYDEKYAAAMKNNFERLCLKLGGPGASSRAAWAMISQLTPQA